MSQLGFWTHKDYDPIPKEERDNLAIRASQGDQEAKDKLIKSCVRFAVRRSMRWAKRNPDIPIDDFIQEAFRGLVEASNVVDPSRGKFLTCAGLHIDKYLKSHYANNSLIRLPWHARWNYKKKTEKTKKLAAAVSGKALELNEFNFVYHDHYCDEIDKEIMMSQVNRAICCLEPKERQIIQEKYFSGHENKSNAFIGRKLNMCKQTICNIEFRALEKIRDILKDSSPGYSEYFST